MKNYLDFQAEDFAADESFQKWVFLEKEKSNRFWEDFLKKYPEKQEEIQEAISLLKQLSPNKVPEQFKTETQEALLRLQENIRRSKVGLKPSSQQKGIYIFGGARWAATVGIVITIGLAYLLWNINSNRQKIYHTAYGEIQRIQLPDGSEVAVNSNSTLKLFNNWDQGDTREVWLSGEAFFKVVKQKNPQNKQRVKFVVHSQNVDVEVLGTQFNVWNRKKKVTVVLNEGKIKLKIKQDNQKVYSLEMRPNQMVEVGGQVAGIEKKNIKPELYTSWQAEEFIFENTPVYQIAQKIEEVYGLKVRFGDEEIKSEKLTGVIPAKNKNLFFEVLSEALNLEIIKKENTGEIIFIRKK